MDEMLNVEKYNFEWLYIFFSSTEGALPIVITHGVMAGTTTGSGGFFKDSFATRLPLGLFYGMNQQINKHCIILKLYFYYSDRYEFVHPRRNFWKWKTGEFRSSQSILQIPQEGSAAPLVKMCTATKRCYAAVGTVLWNLLAIFPLLTKTH
jgi:hypothetical protein